MIKSHPDDELWYRVEFRTEHDVQCVGRLQTVSIHFRVLDIYLSSVPPRTPGHLVLVDERTNAIVARRKVLPQTRASAPRMMTGRRDVSESQLAR
jgi:hypothetical protein